MENSIIYPKQTTHFICYNKDRFNVISYGTVQTTQQMETGQPILDIFLEESEWILILKEKGIDTSK
tara:strand:+ start:804 stop:1001 length:198 start_codon:yes stop_codon:yes gene_type:complete